MKATENSRIGMSSAQENLCIVLARGGSKRIPRKNIRPLHGLPMVAWPVRAAKASNLFVDVLISTEDEEIAKAAQEAGAVYPFVRPQEVADDFSGTSDVLRVALRQWQEFCGILPDICCCLYGTSIFVTKEHLCAGMELLSDTDMVMAVSEYSHPIQRALYISEDGFCNYAHSEFASMRTQDCEPFYHDIGLFYFYRVDALLKQVNSSMSLRRKALIVPRTCAVDIDTEEDLKLAEVMATAFGLVP